MDTRIIKIIALLLIITFYGCNKSDDNIEEILPEEETVAKIVLGWKDYMDIRFVHEDGSPIEEGECIDPAIPYGVAIELNLRNFPNWKTEPILYTLNGTLHNMTFIENGTQVNPIRLEFNENMVQVVEQGDFSDTIMVIDQGDFELVE